MVNTSVKKNLSLKGVGKAVLVTLAVVSVLIVLLASSFFAYMTYKARQDKAKEDKIELKFYQEISQIPNIRVNSFKLWEGDSMVDLYVKDKGTVRLWYGVDGVPRIDNIGGFSTIYDCFNVDDQGVKKRYAYTTGLALDKDSAFKKWFPFEVNNLRDLVSRYDDIIKVLDSFPKNPARVEHKDIWGTKEVVEQPNRVFLLQPDKNRGDIKCDVYTQSQ